MTHFKIKTNLARAAMTLLALFLFLVGTRAQSSTLTVHDGTAKNQYVPIYGYYCDNYLKSEFIFPSTELTEMAGSNISEMTFYLETSAAGSWGNANFKVFLREVEATDFSNATTFMGFSDEDLVYEGALDGTGSTMVISFTDSYYYTGGNLLVGIYNTVLGTWKKSTFYGEEVTNASVYNYNKTSLDNITNLKSGNFLPKTTFEYTKGNPPAAKPKNLAVNYTGGLTATVTWTSDAPSCDIDVNGTVTTGVTSPYTLTGLSLSTDYEVMVRANYGDGQYSSWTSAVSFRTNDCLDEDMCYITYELKANPYQGTYEFGWYGSYLVVMDDAENLIDAWTVEPNDEDGKVIGSIPVCPGKTLYFWWYSNDPEIDELLVGDFSVKDANGDDIISCTGALTEEIHYLVDCVISEFKRPSNLVASEIESRSVVLSWKENGKATAWTVAYKSNTDEDFIEVDADNNPFTLIGLTPSTEYTVKVRPSGENTKWSKNITFTTDVPFPAPMSVAVNSVTSHSAVVGWQGKADSYNLRYRMVERGCSEDFENVESSGLPEGWTSIDLDGDSYTWGTFTPSDPNDANHNPTVFDTTCATSASYIGGGVGALTPDNWLVSPQVDLFGTLSVWLRGQDPNWAQEHFAIYLSTTGNSRSDFTTTLVGETIATGEYVEITADLSAYKGQKGYIAIRHFNCNNMFRLNVDNFSIFGDFGEWVSVNGATSPYTINDLNNETNYQVEIQSVYADGTSEWTSTDFTTLMDNPIPYDVTITPSHTSATISWVGESDSYEVKYRTAEANPTTFFDDFENELDQWTIYTQGGTSSGQTVGWYTVNPISGLQFEAHSGSYAASAWSWNSAAINANNWLVTPQLTFGDSNILKFWVRTNQGYPDKYEVLLSTEGNAITDFTGKGGIVLQAMATATGLGSWVEVSIDLSEYAGQKGYIAIHHQDYDANYLLIDDFGIYGASIPAGEWITIETDDTSVEITGLEMNTEYEYQIIGIKDKTPNNGTALATFTTLTVNDKVFVNAGNWDVDSNWFPAGVPAANENAIIQADAIIPAGVVAEAKNITIDGGSITIKDGGQLKTVTDDLVVTFEKNIEAGKNYLLGFPINDEVNPANVKGLTEGNYGFYSFYSGQANEWVNSKAHDFSIFPLSGYSYSNEEAKTLSCTGPVLRSSGFLFYDDLVYDATSTDFFNGFVMVGNPFVCTGYFTCFDQDGQNVMPSYFFKLNAEGTGFDLYYGYVSLEPGEAALLMYGENGTLYLQSDPIFTFEPEAEEGTYNIAALPEPGQNTDQDANPLLELSFAAEGFATYYDSMYDIKLPAGMKARVVIAQNGADKLTYQTIADGDGTDGLPNVVPADTPVMLQIEPSLDAQTASVRLDFGAPAINTVNLLKGSDEETTTTGGDMYYKLTYSNNNDNFGWYWGAANGAAFTSPANKAWLALPASGARSFYGLPGFDGDNFGTTTGVHFASDNEGQDGDWYSVDGRKLNAKPKTKGVYILNGKKTVIR